MSLLPTATPYSRNAIFCGLFPDEMVKKYPKQGDDMKNDSPSLNQYEKQFLIDQLKKIDLAKKDPSGEIVLTENGKTLLSEMKLQPKVMKRNVIDTDGRPTFLDDLLGEL